MGRSYQVPRNVKGESRILFFFSVRSFLTTAGGIIVGVIFVMLFSAIGLGVFGFILLVFCALLGFALGALTIPDTKIMGKFRKAGGELLGDIVWRTLTFNKRKKIYMYDYNRGGDKKWDKE